MSGRRAYRAATCGLALALMLVSPFRAVAQEDRQSSFLTDIAKRVAMDPTTYMPAVIAYDATRRDWRTSQPFFEHGFLERNPRFTMSGLPNDLPVSHGEGNRRIAAGVLVNLQVSLVNNLAENFIERVLVERHPEHRTLWRTLGWMERIAVASYASYRLSIEHYRQAQRNQELARQYGW